MKHVCNLLSRSGLGHHWYCSAMSIKLSWNSMRAWNQPRYLGARVCGLSTKIK
ncbi:hypothetical protein BDV33DRAFT_170922 [Aspergillus novoparasiticus]|uniref:Uncharacterized protein n=1 Tax=Aspergillus novoparasiticus TaxID=986946 RepID=A0A5N6EW11_9EURO|nr:hypothetical protein BDV33DRAFT_170922 [Aspergillus novoparasiticus]